MLVTTYPIKHKTHKNEIFPTNDKMNECSRRPNTKTFTEIGEKER